jgi:hypothetical protein
MMCPGKVLVLWLFVLYFVLCGKELGHIYTARRKGQQSGGEVEELEGVGN